MDIILGYIAEIGLEAGKEKIKGPILEAAARKRLNEFLKRQCKLNFNCTMEEEIDFGGLADYIRHDLMDDVKLRLFGDKDERDIARKTIVNKASYYAQSKTRIPEQRAKMMVGKAIDILRKYYESKINRDLSYLAGRVEDTVIDEMSDQHANISDKIEELNIQVSSAALLSLDQNIKLANSGEIGKVNDNFSMAMEAINSSHPLKPYYGFNMERRDCKYQMVSIPLFEEAAIKYPPRFNITASSVCVGSKDISELQNCDVFDYSYRHQLPITLDVSTANKLLGDIPDPIQAEAKEMEGSKMIIMPPKFPKAFPCSISMNDETVFDYLLMRTKEILEDGTALVTNEEQDNRPFDVVFSVNQKSKKMNFNICPLNLSNTEQLEYRKFIRNASKGGPVTIKALSLNALLGAGNINPFIPSEALDAEIEFLEKITAIERYFHISLIIPQEISIDDHQVIDYVYSIIQSGSFSRHWSTFNTTFEINEILKKRIAETDDITYLFTYTCVENVELFDQQFSFPMKRELRSARFKDLERIKRKAEVLDIGDTITLNFVPDETDGNNTYIDTFAKEEEVQSE